MSSPVVLPTIANPVPGDVIILPSVSDQGGEVVGPGPGAGTSTIGAVARWEDTTGTTLENSTVLIDDYGNVYGAGFLGNNSVSNPLTIAVNKQLIIMSEYTIASDITINGILAVL